MNDIDRKKIEALQPLNRHKNWYVFDPDFSFNLANMQQDVFSVTGEFDTPVIFCDTCDANRILERLGEEEKEFLFGIYGLFHEEKEIIFIFNFEEEPYEKVLETIFHEQCHALQYQTKEQKDLFFSETHLPYEKRQIEIEAKKRAAYLLRFFQHKQKKLG